MEAIRSIARVTRTPIGFVVSFLAGALVMLLGGPLALHLCPPLIALWFGFALRSPLVWLALGFNLILVGSFTIPEAFPERQRGIMEDFGTSRIRTLLWLTASFGSGVLVGLVTNLLFILSTGLVALVLG